MHATVWTRPLGLNHKISPMEYKGITLKSRKSMMETGKLVSPVDLQIVSCTGIVIMYERALDCIQELEIPNGGGRRWVFTQPIPTMAGLLCSECKKCQACGQDVMDEGDRVKCKGRWIRVCLMCIEQCPVCAQGKLKHHNCCENKSTAQYFSMD